MFRHILVPVDYSENSRKSLKFAAELAKGLGARLDIVHVWDKPSYVGDEVMVKQGAEQHVPLSDLIREAAEREMSEFLARAALPTDVKFERRLCPGDPVSALIEQAKKGKHDIIVIGTHGRTGLAHMLLGSVTEKLIRLSPIPVLTVPPEQA